MLEPDLNIDEFFPPERRICEGFVLRCWRPGDGPLLQDASNASYLHLKRFMHWARPDQTTLENEKLVRMFRAHFLLSEDFALGVFSPDERRVLGGTGFHLSKRPISKRSAEIGMWIRSSGAGLGLGTRVLREMLAWGFTQWPWMRLSWRASENNLASRRTAEKAGMLQEGVFQCDDYDAEGNRCSTVVYGLTREQWMSSGDGVCEIKTESLGD